jgi:hypothetical protein
MKFDYKIYRPSKSLKDMRVSRSSYFQAKDVRVSPSTKIGDVADMPTPSEQQENAMASDRKPIFTKGFNRSRLAFSQASKTEKVKIPVKIAEDEVAGEHRVAVNYGARKLHSISSVRPSGLQSAKSFRPHKLLTSFISAMASVRQQPALIKANLRKYLSGIRLRNSLLQPRYAILAVAVLAIGTLQVHSLGSNIVRSVTHSNGDSINTSGSASTAPDSHKQKSKAQAANKAATPTLASSTPANTPTPVPQEVTQNITDNSSAADTSDASSGDSVISPTAPPETTPPPTATPTPLPIVLTPTPTEPVPTTPIPTPSPTPTTIPTPSTPVPSTQIPDTHRLP